MFYITGFIDFKKSCGIVTWYLACEFWFAALYPLIALVYNKKKILGIGLNILLILTIWGQNFYASYFQGLGPLQTYREAMPTMGDDFKSDMYGRPT